MIAHIPFPDLPRHVAMVTEHFSKRRLVRQRHSAHHAVFTKALRIGPHQQAVAARAARRIGDIHLREHHALFREPVDLRCRDIFAAERADIPHPEIIDK